jgi:Phage portal protein, SPP1 Gp6-like
VATPEILHRLCFRLDRLETQHRRLAAYDAGNHPLAYASDKFQTAFGQSLRALADNWIPTVVNAVSERLRVDGFRFGTSPNADDDAWAMWQDNSLDRDSRLAHRDALLYGRSFVLVWGDDEGDPRITVESPRQCLTMASPGDRREVIAGMKRWLEFDGTARAMLYLPDAIIGYISEGKVAAMDDSGSNDPAIDARNIGMLTTAVAWVEDSRIDNPLGVVPLVPMMNNADALGGAVSEVAAIIPMQDMLNKLVADLLIASEFASFRQRWASGVEIPVDPETEQPIEPFSAAVSRVWISESDQAKFGSFEATDLNNIVKAVEMVVQHLASMSRVPTHYMSASADRLSGESIKASEAGLVALCRRKMSDFGETHERVMRLAFAVTGDPRADETAAETIWGDPEIRTESEHADALTKLQSLGVPDAQLWEDWGYSPQAIERFRQMQRAAALDATTLGLTALVAPTPAPPVPPSPAPADEEPRNEPGEPAA